jgi:outer membrane protein assembly factor BamB
MNKQFICIFVSLLLVSTVLPVVGTQPAVLKTKQSPQASPVIRGDTSDWPMIRHDPSHTGASPSLAPATGTVLWNRSVGSPAGSSPLESSNRVYFSSNDGVIYCLDAQTGNITWMSLPLGSPFEKDAGIANDRLYISADKVYCFDALNGSQLWNQTIGANGSAPTIVNNRVYIGAEKVYCLDAGNGSLIWNFSAVNTSFFTSVALIDDTVFVGDVANAQLYCLNASNGNLTWNVSLAQYGQSSTSPAVVDGKVYLGTWGGWMLCFNATNGNLTWGQPIGDQIRSSPAVASGYVYFGCNNTYVYCYNALNGTFLWGAPTGGPVNSSPAVADGKVYISSDMFYCFDAMTGSEIWTHSTGGGASSPAIANREVFVCGNNESVYCFLDRYPPDIPSTPAGSPVAGPAIQVNFSTVTTDFEGDPIYFMWDWGDGNLSEWFGPFASNQSMTANHSWQSNGTYDVRVKAKDASDGESAWSEPLAVTIAPQISLANFKLGYVYFRVFSFNSSFFYIDLLFNLGLAVVVSNHDLYVVADTTPAVHSVMMMVYTPTLNASMTRWDNDSTDGFVCTFNVTRDVYEIVLTAYDANGTLIDQSIFSLVFFFRIGPQNLPPVRTLGHALRGHQYVHH